MVWLKEQYDKIYRYCYFRLHDRERAEDITQEAFLRLLERYPDIGRGGNGKENQALPLLYTIARNLCIDEFRKPRPEYRGWEEFEVDEAVWSDAGGKTIRGNSSNCNTEEQLVMKHAVAAALQRLCSKDRELLLLRYVNELPVGTITKVLQLSRFSVYRRVMQAKRRLQEELLKEDIHEG
ncbi:MAG: RNA polymerase sigma factor [Lachnospiraceae bacterium]|nr:RNA polymerase sigma factor [Lachnospiraceae bacterium]